MKIDEVVDCKRCGEDTPMLGTKLCDRCWELENRIKADPEIAREILGQIDSEVRGGVHP